jgi:hypothetical protein
MNNRKIPIGIMVALSIAALSMGLSFLLPALQQQAYAISQSQSNGQNSLTIPGSNADDEPTTLTFHDKGHCHQYIQDHPGLAVDKKDCTGAS